MKTIKTSNNGRESIEPVTETQPKSGGIAPAKPPITMFCVPVYFKIFV